MTTEVETPRDAGERRRTVGRRLGRVLGRKAGGPAPAPKPTLRERLSLADIRYSPYLYITPFFVLFAIFGMYPLVYTAWVSLHDWDLIGDHTWIGLDNYTKLVGDDLFWNALFNTAGMFVLATVPQLTIALALASLLNRRLRARTFFRLSFIIPLATSVAAVAIVFGQLFARDFGMVNWVLGGLGVDPPINWEATKLSSWTAISVMVDWRWTGYNALIYLAAMQAIPRDLYESAAIDGASAWRQFTSITIPLLRPTILFTVIISTIGGFQLFVEPLLFNSGANGIQGGSLRQSQTAAMYVYENAFSRFDFGYAAAVAWVLFLIIILASAVNYLLIRRLHSAD
jgi:cellobiose transport system permease protein